MATVVHDRSGVLTPEAIRAIESMTTRIPEVHVVLDVVPSVEALGHAAHLAITAPNVLAVAIDPVHHRTSVHYGTALGVPEADRDGIAKAGTPSFRSGDWAGGIRAIVTETEARGGQVVTVLAPAPAPAAHVSVAPQSAAGDSGVSAVEIVVWCAIGLTVFGLVWWVVRKMRQMDEVKASLTDERNEYLLSNVDRMTSPGVSTPSPRAPRAASYAPPMPASPTVIVQPGYSSSSNDFLTGMLVGESLSQPRVVEREIVRERSYDADSGGGSSSWSSSDDSGGGSSDWGSSDSGGSDWGGGDSGGGGDAW